MKLKDYVLVYILRIIEVITQVIVFTLLLMMTYAYFTIQNTSFLTFLFVASTPVVVLYCARMRCRQGILLAIIHICVIIFMLLIGKTVEEKIANTLICIILTVVSINHRITENQMESEKMPVGMVVICIAGMIIGNYLKLDMLANAGLYCGEVFIILQVIYRNISNLLDFFQLNGEISSLPVKQMLSVNTFIMTILVTLCGGIMLLFRNSAVNHMLRSILTLIKDAILYLVRLFFSLFQHSEEKSVIQEKIKTDGFNGMSDAPKTSIWAEILHGVLYVVGIILVIAVVVGLIIGIVMTIVNLVKRMNSTPYSEDVKEFILAKEFKEFKLRQRSRKDITEKSSNAKIRRLYKSIIKKNAGKSSDSISASMVPRDISDLYIPGDKKTATEIYEKARYSDQQITKEEIGVLKEYRKG